MPARANLDRLIKAMLLGDQHAGVKANPAQPSVQSVRSDGRATANVRGRKMSY